MRIRDFWPTGDHRALAIKLGLDVDHQCARFKGYFSVLEQSGSALDAELEFAVWLQEEARTPTPKKRPGRFRPIDEIYG